ncbi:MAG: dihydropteroate synthase [Xanthomonadaceae bacterium]|nr:dihydropteroate synthase [Xanthomonadaceae bacterium]
MFLRCATRTLDLSEPIVMGVLNVTPDSFSDAGQFLDPERAIEHGLRMVEAGAGFIDVGGESTRPGAAMVPEEEELRRVVPVIEALVRRVDVPISVDTSKPRVMRAAVEAGAELINDIYALRLPGALEAARDSGAAVCLMHMQGEPRTMQIEPRYDDVVAEVRDFLNDRVAVCLEAGLQLDRLVVDPVIGFGKRLQHNLALLAALPTLGAHGVPVLVGVSRKSMFKDLLGRPVDERLPGALAVATASVLAGARIVRTHDVRETLDAVKVAAALKRSGYRMATNGDFSVA